MNRTVRQALSETLIRTPALHVKFAVGDYPDLDSTNSLKWLRHRLGEAVADQLENQIEDHVVEAIYES